MINMIDIMINEGEGGWNKDVLGGKKLTIGRDDYSGVCIKYCHFYALIKHNI